MKTFAWTVPEPRHSQSAERVVVEFPDVRSRLCHPLWVASAILFAFAFLLLMTKSAGGIGVLFFLPFSFGPMIVSLLLGFAALSRKSLLTLLIANTLYFGWFLWVYIHAFYLHPDPQAGIAFIFIGVYSLPVMIPLWLVALCLRRSKSADSKHASEPSPSLHSESGMDAD